MSEIETKRMVLRQWRETDFDSFYSLNSDPDVMKYFPKLFSREESNELAIRLESLIYERGWGLWAAERKLDGSFIGFVGLHQIKSELPFFPGIELGWRLHKHVWRQGYASEAAVECINYAFIRLKVDEILAYTAIQNFPSIGVMRKIGMQYTGIEFDHPMVSVSSNLSRHCLYKISSAQWSSFRSDV